MIKPPKYISLKIPLKMELIEEVNLENIYLIIHSVSLYLKCQKI